MRKILFACVLMIGTSNSSVADEYLKILHKQCMQGSMEACSKGRKVTCLAGLNYGRETVYFKKGLCGVFQLAEGIGLYKNGDYVGSRKALRRAIQSGNLDAQKAMGNLCSRQPWVCRSGLL